MPLMINGKKPERTGQREMCPLCGNEVISVCGQIRIWHWRHIRKGDCIFAGETDWHLGWKEFFHKLGCKIEQIFIINGVKRIADVVLENGMVVEIQNIPNPETFLDRCSHYVTNGIAWILHSGELRTGTTGIIIPSIESDLEEILVTGRQKRLMLILGEANRLGVPVFIDAPGRLYWIWQGGSRVVGSKINKDHLLNLLVKLNHVKEECKSALETSFGGIDTRINNIESQMDAIIQEAAEKQGKFLNACYTVSAALNRNQDIFDNIMANEKHAVLGILRKDSPLMQKERVLDWILKFIQLAADLRILQRIFGNTELVLKVPVEAIPCTDETKHAWEEYRATLATLRQERLKLRGLFGKGESHPEKEYPKVLPECKAEWLPSPIMSRLMGRLEMTAQELKDLFRAQATQFIGANYLEPSKKACFLERVEAILDGREDKIVDTISLKSTIPTPASTPVASPATSSPVPSLPLKAPAIPNVSALTTQKVGMIPYWQKGTCIRCGNKVPLDLARPLCPRCYGMWAEYKNPDYPERFCHVCGRSWRTTIERPLCRPCECSDGHSSGRKQPKLPRRFYEGRISF